MPTENQSLNQNLARQHASRAIEAYRKEYSTDLKFRGVPISEFSKDELLVLVGFAFNRWQHFEDKEMHRLKHALDGLRT